MFSPFSLPPNPPVRWWPGASGSRYYFSVYGFGELWDFDGVVYIAARARSDGFFDPLYIGQTGEGGVRFSRHEKLASARSLGMTHVHVHFLDDRRRRLDVETDLRRHHWTPLNEQPTPAPMTGLGDAFTSPVPYAVPIGALGLAGISAFESPGDLGALGSLLAQPPDKYGR